VAQPPGTRADGLLLLVEPDHPAGRRLREALAEVGLDVREVASLDRLEQSLIRTPFDTACLRADLAGPEAFAGLRRRHAGVALIAWLPRPSTDLAGELLVSGADEVLVSAMGRRELVARLRRVVGRRGGVRAPAAEWEGVEVDLAHGEVAWRGQQFALTRREREVLHVLVTARGRPVRRQDIYRQVWGFSMARGDRSVDVNVKRLRDKLAALPDASVAITTQPGVGYRLGLSEPETQAVPAGSGDVV
jgi:DNA-binding response OmpR family regulator